MPMRLCGVCAKPTKGETVHATCRKPRPYDSVAHRAISAMFRATGRKCADCGTPGTQDNPITAHHDVPVAHGGASVPDNYVPLCRRCNSARGTRTGTE